MYKWHRKKSGVFRTEQARDESRVRGEAHADHDRGRLAHEIGDRALELDVHRRGAQLGARAARGDRVVLEGLVDPLVGACKTTVLFLSAFPYVCPQPVLVKRSFLNVMYKWLKKRRFSYHHSPQTRGSCTSQG